MGITLKGIMRKKIQTNSIDFVKRQNVSKLDAGGVTMSKGYQMLYIN
jgi:hypothetical protein